MDGVASDTRRVDLGGYAKLNSTDGPYCVANEYVASRLAHVLGLPVPPGGVIPDPSKAGYAWATMSFEPDGRVLPPIHPATAVAASPQVCAMILMFDVLIGNADRHRRNLAFRPSSKRIEVYDHSHTLFGLDPDGADHLRRTRDHFIVNEHNPNRHCLLDATKNANEVMGAIDRVRRRIDIEIIQEVCDAVASLRAVTAPEAKELEIWLRRRSDILDRIVYDHRTEFRGITEDGWGLLER